MRIEDTDIGWCPYTKSTYSFGIHFGWCGIKGKKEHCGSLRSFNHRRCVIFKDAKKKEERDE